MPGPVHVMHSEYLRKGGRKGGRKAENKSHKESNGQLLEEKER
jgi:hypothetical protein